MTDRLRRSFLYTPADDRDMMAKAADSAADAVIFDLEDAVPDDAVSESRENVAAVLRDTDFGRTEVCVRINGLQTERWETDLEASVEAGVDTVILPMVERPDHLDRAVEVAGEAAQSASGETPDAARSASDEVPEFVATIETPKGLFAVDDIAVAGGELASVTGLSYGFGDYTRAVGATGRPDRIRDFLSETVVSAAALGGLDPIATVYQDFSDTEGLREEAAACREIGYVGQKAIHPAQLDVINDTYTPTAEEVEEARRLVDAFDAAERDSLVADGVFLDTAIVEQYRTVLDRHAEVAE
ncbi:HpcH/HpaI aldolase/citrate lyase family protein [Halorussus salinisoli]|uniref:HpcH/HpaI aldolase/citrate lyase family protein n=1 Tax=Halorussus salinisoli TaxID=2558242 RepID=UPI0010C1D5FF|nr:CoA ester lyase [Halorussus salinisoli]